MSKPIIEIEGKSILDFDYVDGIGPRVKISGGNDYTGIFFTKLKITGKVEIVLSSKKKDLEKFNFSHLTGAKIELAEANEVGDLTIQLSSGDKLFFEHEESIEGWELRWINKLFIVSLPGGTGISIFEEDSKFN